MKKFKAVERKCCILKSIRIISFACCWSTNACIQPSLVHAFGNNQVDIKSVERWSDFPGEPRDEEAGKQYFLSLFLKVIA